MTTVPSRRYSLPLAIAISAIVFLLDLFVELGVATGTAYIVVVYLAYAAGSRRGVWVAAYSGSLLTLLGLIFSAPGSEVWKVLTNRALAIVAIWVTALLCLRVLRLLAAQTQRVETAEQSAADLAWQREEEARKRRVMASIMDDLRIQQEKLAASEERTRLTIDSALDAVVTIDQEGVVTDWNPQAERTFGWSRAEAIGQTLAELIVPPQYRDAHRRGLEHFRATGEAPVLNQQLELSALRRNGEEFPVELTISRLALAEGSQFSAFLRDITERKRAQEVRTQLAAIIESSDDAITGKTLDGIVTSWNRGAEALYGYTAEEMIGQPVSRLVPPDGADEVSVILQRLRRGDSVRNFETQRLRKDGSRRDVSLTISPIINAQGEIVGASTIARDITERKQWTRQLARANEELERTNAELEQFAYVASHDLRSPLRAIDNLAKWIAEDAGNDLSEQCRGHIAKMQQRVQRMEKLLSDLLHYSRAGRTHHALEIVDTGRMIREITELLGPPDGFSISVADNMPTLATARPPLEQVFMNLIANALKHHDRPRGRLAISARELDSYFEFSVADDGPGIDPEFHERVFRMFQTLQPRDKVEGSGVGLAVVKKVVESCGGTVTVDSADGRGATFRFTWPKADADRVHSEYEGAMARR